MMSADPSRQQLDELWTRALAPDSSDLEVPVPDVPFSVAGGHSLAAARLVAAVRDRLGRRLSIVDLLRADPTPDQLARMVADAPEGEPPAAVPTAAERSLARAPLARSMQPVWAFHRLNPGSPAYNVLRVLSIAGRVAPGALRAAADVLADRHDALRCAIVESRPGRPEVVARPAVVPSVGVQVVRVDPATVPAQPDWEIYAPEQVETALRGAADRPFEMASAPLWRLHLVYCPELDRSWLLLAAHHLIADLRASDVLLADLERAYRDTLSGTPPDRTPAASLLRQLLAEEASDRSEASVRRRAADLDWWAATLGERPAASPVPLSTAAGPEDDYAAETSSAALPTAAVEALAHRHRVTRATVLLTAAGTVLAAWRGWQDGDVIGVPSARAVGGDDTTPVGLLVDSIPICPRIDPHRTFGELCLEFRDRYLDALEHSSSTLGDIMGRLAIPRRSTRDSLVSLWFNDLEHAARPDRFGDAEVLEYDLVQRWALFSCGLYVRRTRAGLRMHAVVPIGSMAGADLQAFLGQIDRLVRRAAEDPAAAVQRLVAAPEPGTTAPAELRETPVSTAERVRDRASRTPDAVAVHHPGGSVSYARLAADITAATARWDATCRVALGAERSYPHVVNRCAAGGAGASIVLIDRSWPVWRQRAALVVSGASDAAGLDPEVLDGIELAARDPNLAGVAIQFTSGSTGTPLAVATPDPARQVSLEQLGRWLGLRAEDRVCFLSGPAHDPSWRDIDLPLRNGATLVLPPDGVQADPSRLLGWLRDNRISVLNATPPLLALAVGDAEPPLPDLRVLVCGGSPLPAALARRLRELAPGATLVNGYGCTETPQLLTALRLEAADDLPGRAELPIGTALPDRLAEVRTGAGLRCDVGQLGTVWAGSPFIAAGYLGLHPAGDERLAGRFVTDERGRRWFDTGDLARADAAGNLLLYGRADRQHLVNGHRIVLDEVEATVRDLAGVSAARAEVVSTGSADTLWLFVRPSDGSKLTEADLRETLRSRLPAAAVPSRIVLTDRLGLNASLKPQVPAGLVPEPAPVAEQADAAPAVTALAESILGAPIRATDNFFEAGFNSVTLLHFNAELCQLLGTEIPATMLFRHPSLDRLLHRLGIGQPATAGPRRRPPVPPTAPASSASTGPASAASTAPASAASSGSVRERRRELRRSIARGLDPSAE